MESVSDLLEQLFLVVVFCAALALLFFWYWQSQELVTDTKEMMTRQHVLSEMDGWE